MRMVIEYWRKKKVGLLSSRICASGGTDAVEQDPY
jgi:hypothetical protein